MKKVINNIKIAIDLELEQPNTNHQTPDSRIDSPKIIQLGWSVFNQETGKILNEGSRFVNIGVPISSFIKGLTRITDEQISSGGTVTSAFMELRKVRELHNADRTMVEWGSGDFVSLRDEVIDESGKSYWNEINAFGRSPVNVKHLYRVFRESNGLNPSGGLSRAVAGLGLTWSGQGKHDAMIDARNTAMVYCKLFKAMRSPNE